MQNKVRGKVSLKNDEWFSPTAGNLQMHHAQCSMPSAGSNAADTSL